MLLSPFDILGDSRSPRLSMGIAHEEGCRPVRHLQTAAASRRLAESPAAACEPRGIGLVPGPRTAEAQAQLHRDLTDRILSLILD